MKGTIVIISVVHWHFTWQTVHNVAAGMAERGYQVLFVEPLPKRWPAVSELRRVWGRLTGNSLHAGMCEQPLIDGVELWTPRMLPDVGAFAQSVNKRYFTPRLASQIRAHQQQRPLIVLNYLPTHASLALMEALEPDISIYHCVNDWANDPYAQSNLVETEMALAVDMVWADSVVNIGRMRAAGVEPARMTKGVNSRLFSEAQRDPTHPPPERPRCAFFGTVSVTTNVELLAEVSKRFPLLVVGPVRVPLTGLSDTADVTGGVPVGQVPRLIREADVLLLPYSDAAHVPGIMPAKLYEVLATGKPAIVYGLPEIDEFGEFFTYCRTSDEFMQAIADAVHESPTKRRARIAHAEANSYERRLSEMEAHFERLLKDSQRTEVHNGNPASVPG